MQLSSCNTVHKMTCKDKNSIDVQKAFNKVQYSITIKQPELGSGGTRL